MVLGSLLLFRTPELYAQVSLGVILPITLFFAAFFAVTIYLVVKAQRTSSRVGAEGLMGETAEVYSWNQNGTGKVFCHGEYWNATGPVSLKPGEKVVITHLTGLDLSVKLMSGGDEKGG